jgi:hypothetical protein
MGSRPDQRRPVPGYVTETDHGLARALARARTALQATAVNTRISEARFEEELVTALKNDDALRPVEGRRPKLRDWPNLGSFEIRLANDAVVELKWWGTATSARYQTLWDACKVANAIDEQIVPVAYLIAGGHNSIWAKNDGYTGLFDSGEHEVLPLCIPPANWWTSPANDRTTITTHLLTTAIAEAAFDVEGEPYTLRCSRVAPLGGRVPVPPYVSVRTQRMHSQPS